MALEKAKLETLKEDGGGTVTLQFNPTKYQVQRAVNWKANDKKGSKAPPMEFVQGQGRTVTMEFIVDDYEEKTPGAVVDKVKELYKLTVPDPKNAKDAKKARPPRVMFMWANDHAQFPAVVKNLNVTYTLFHETGKPRRATVSLTLQEWPEDAKGQNPTSMGNSGVSTHRVIAGETLDLIAYQELGAAHRWKYIAELNNIDSPLNIRPGQHLVIAPLR
jgi:nucleoid-associated protein YgaU